MIIDATHPDRPYPFVVPPTREPAPQDRPLPPVPMVDMPFDDSDVDHLLLARRRVLLSGPLDTAAANRVAAQLMALDGQSARSVELGVNSPGGPLAELFTILDVLDLMRAPVGTVCFGQAAGTAAFVLAGGTDGRRVTRNARVTLRCAGQEAIRGTSGFVIAAAEQHRDLRERAASWLAERVARSSQQVLADLDEGPWLDADEACALGLADEVVTSR